MYRDAIRAVLARAAERVLLREESGDPLPGLSDAARAIKHCGDYGYGYYRNGTVWWVAADSDSPQNGFTSSARIKHVLGNVPGVKSVMVEYEAFPNDKDQWRRFGATSREGRGSARYFLREALSGGHWLTIEDEEGVATHIYVSHGGGNGKKGQVIAGPSHLIGANIAHLPPAPHFRTTEHKEGHTPAGATSHPSYTEHNFTKKVYGKFGPGVGKEVPNPLEDKTEAEAHTAFNAAHNESRAQAGKEGPAPTKEQIAFKAMKAKADADLAAKSTAISTTYKAADDGKITLDQASAIHDQITSGEVAPDQVDAAIASAVQTGIAAKKAKDIQDAHGALDDAYDKGVMSGADVDLLKHQMKNGVSPSFAHNAVKAAHENHAKMQAEHQKKVDDAHAALAKGVADGYINGGAAEHMKNKMAGGYDPAKVHDLLASMKASKEKAQAEAQEKAKQADLIKKLAAVSQEVTWAVSDGALSHADGDLLIHQFTNGTLDKEGLKEKIDAAYKDKADKAAELKKQQQAPVDDETAHQEGDSWKVQGAKNNLKAAKAYLAALHKVPEEDQDEKYHDKQVEQAAASVQEYQNSLKDTQSYEAKQASLKNQIKHLPGNEQYAVLHAHGAVEQAIHDKAMTQDEGEALQQQLLSGDMAAPVVHSKANTAKNEHYHKGHTINSAHYSGNITSDEHKELLSSISGGKGGSAGDVYSKILALKSAHHAAAEAAIDQAVADKQIIPSVAKTLKEKIANTKPGHGAHALLAAKIKAKADAKAKTEANKAAGIQPVNAKTVPVQYIGGQASAHIDPHQAEASMHYMNSLKKTATGAEITRAEAKQEIAEAVGPKLKSFMSDAQAEALRQEMNLGWPGSHTDIHETLAAGLVHQWAVTSGNSHKSPLAIQLAAQAEFGLSNWATTDPGHAHGDSFPQAVALANHPEHGPLLRKCLRTFYEHTQEAFKKAGITHVTLTRGVNNTQSDEIRDAFDGKSGDHAILDVPAGHLTTNPMTSWATTPEISTLPSFLENNYGGNWGPKKTNTLLMSTVPVEQIFSHVRSGMGCLNEDEMVCLGNDKPYTVIAADSREIAKSVATSILKGGRAPQHPQNPALAPVPGAKASKATLPKRIKSEN